MILVKRISTLLLLSVFVLSTSGISVYKHYCKDFLASVSFYHSHNPCASDQAEESCSKDKEMSCCDDEVEFHQLAVDLQKVNSQEVKFALQALSILLPDFEFDQQLCSTLEEVKPDPPPSKSPPIYLSTKRLIFYG